MQAINGVVITADDPAASVFINNCTFQYVFSNEIGPASGLGGAVYATGSLSIENSTFRYNTFKQSNQSGGDFSSMTGSSSAYLSDLYPNCTGPLYWISDSWCDPGERCMRLQTQDYTSLTSFVLAEILSGVVRRGNYLFCTCRRVLHTYTECRIDPSKR